MFTIGFAGAAAALGLREMPGPGCCFLPGRQRPGWRVAERRGVRRHRVREGGRADAHRPRRRRRARVRAGLPGRRRDPGRAQPSTSRRADRTGPGPPDRVRLARWRGHAQRGLASYGPSCMNRPLTEPHPSLRFTRARPTDQPLCLPELDALRSRPPYRGSGARIRRRWRHQKFHVR